MLDYKIRLFSLKYKHQETDASINKPEDSMPVFIYLFIGGDDGLENVNPHQRLCS